MDRCCAADCIAVARHVLTDNGAPLAHYCERHWLAFEARLETLATEKAALVAGGCAAQFAERILLVKTNGTPR